MKKILLVIAGVVVLLSLLFAVGYYTGHIMVMYNIQKPWGLGLKIYSRHSMMGYQRSIIQSKRGLHVAKIQLYNGMDAPSGVQVKIFCIDLTKKVDIDQ